MDSLEVEAARGSNRLSIRVFPDTALSSKADVVKEFDDRLVQTVIDMYGVLKELGGMGLSACQVGVNQQIFVIKSPDREGVFINPVVSSVSSDTSEMSEGCLSIPGVYVKVERANGLTLSWQDETGTQHTEEFTGLLARCIQHEMDHQSGKTIIDYLSRLKKDIIKRKMVKFQKRLKRIEEVDKNVRRRALRAQQ